MGGFRGSVIRVRWGGERVREVERENWEKSLEVWVCRRAVGSDISLVLCLER